MRPAVPANLFGVGFGLCGLAQMWSAVLGEARGHTFWPVATAWLLAAAVWLVTLVAYVAGARSSRPVRALLAHPVQGPFTALAAIVPMLLGVALARYDRPAGEAVFVAGLMLTVCFGSWISAQWIVAETRLAQWHPGYSLPTVTGGLLGAAGSAELGHRTLSHVMFGYGVACWVALGSILLLRLFTQAPLPDALSPTMAIEVAPPVVAAQAWLTLNGGRLDLVAAALAGHALLMVLVQVALVPVYRRAPFGPGYWAFAFSCTATVTLGIRWLDIQRVPGRTPLTWLAALAVTAVVAFLAGRTVCALMHGTLLTRPAIPTD